MPGQKPTFDLQPKAQANMSEAARAALDAAAEQIPFTLNAFDETGGLDVVLAAAAAAGEAGHGPDDPHDLLGILSNIPGRANEHVAFTGNEDRIEVTPDRGQAGSHVPDWMDFG